jgi:hypothetical protein
MRIWTGGGRRRDYILCNSGQSLPANCRPRCAISGKASIPTFCYACAAGAVSTSMPIGVCALSQSTISYFGLHCSHAASQSPQKPEPYPEHRGEPRASSSFQGFVSVIGGPNWHMFSMSSVAENNSKLQPRLRANNSKVHNLSNAEQPLSSNPYSTTSPSTIS